MCYRVTDRVINISLCAEENRQDYSNFPVCHDETDRENIRHKGKKWFPVVFLSSPLTPCTGASSCSLFLSLTGAAAPTPRRHRRPHLISSINFSRLSPPLHRILPLGQARRWAQRGRGGGRCARRSAVEAVRRPGRGGRSRGGAWSRLRRGSASWADLAAAQVGVGGTAGRRHGRHGGGGRIR